MNDFILAEQTHEFIRGRTWEVVVLPFGATEPHNLHMPYGTDNFQADAVARAACERAYRRGASVLCLPTLPFGVNTNYFQVPGALACSLRPSTLAAVIADLVDSMQRRGVRKMVLLNGHGGNELKPVLRELHADSKVFLFLCDWYKVGKDKFADIFREPGEHADEIETSMGLAFFPALLKPQRADAGATRPTRFEAVNKGWVSITRPWHLATTNTGMGNPAAATADKGRKLMELVVERIGDFLYELAGSPIDDRFPYG
jgi:creatinine amidohydrolase